MILSLQRFLPVFATCLLAILGTVVAQAQPANDNFANAWSISGVLITTNGTTAGASKEPGEPNHAGNPGSHSVWFNWTAPATAPVQLDTIGSSGGFQNDTLLAVYTGDAVNALTPIAANNNVPGLPNGWSQLQFRATNGITYHIAVDSSRFGGFVPPGGPIVLNLRMLASIAIDSPTNGAVFAESDLITVSVIGDVPAPPVTRVDFYRGGSLFGSSSTAPFSAIASNSPAASNSFYIVALDSAGLSWTSSVVNVAIVKQGVTLLTPADGTIYINPTPISLLAYPYLPSGSIVNVEFFADGIKFAEDATPPFNVGWTNLVGGSHRFTAVGTSDTGATYTSQPVNVSVPQILVASNSVWKFLDNGSDQGTAWIRPDFDDSLWASGPAPLGYGDSQGRQPLTTNSFGPEVTNKFVTTYYRQAFTATNLASFIAVLINLQRDDGAVLYLNGTEVGRNNMPNGTITYRTLASGTAFDDGTATFTTLLPSGLLQEGQNVFAVEIHQDSGNSSDIWFNLSLAGIPFVIRNQSPIVALTAPTNNTILIAPSVITLQATASDPDGSVAKVEFFSDNIKIGDGTLGTDGSYSFDWINPPLGLHSLKAVATDDQKATQASALVQVTLYDEIHTPFAQITKPANGTVVEGPTNLLVTAYASALDGGVTNVLFLANGVPIGQDDSSPYSVKWDAPFGSNAFQAVAFGANGLQGTSVVSSIIITIPPTNTEAPYIVSVIPAFFANVTNVLTNIAVRFSERVQGVDASDLLINGVPATRVTGSGSNYVFSFAQPAFGAVEVAVATGSGIYDFGWPANLPFDDLGPNTRWEYDLIDKIAPTIVARSPAAGVTLTNLTEISVTFSERVSGVDASDLLVNGTPAYLLSGSGSNYIFKVSQPPSGTVTVSWATSPGIVDQAEFPNTFNSTAAAASWQFVLDARLVLVQSNSVWQYFKGTSEASTPTDAWRELSFDGVWPTSLAPFFYGDPYTNAVISGTYLGDMQNNYSTVYFRKEFAVPNAAAVDSLVFNVQIDDGFIAWVNGNEVLRYNVYPGDMPYSTNASTSSFEPLGAGAAYVLFTVTNASAFLESGRNILAVHALNTSIGGSDFGFNAQVFAFLNDIGVTAPRVVQASPQAGVVYYLTNLTVTFSEPVSGVDAADLLVNGVAAASVTSSGPKSYTFDFPQPVYGSVVITWATMHGIIDFDEPPKPFDGSAASSTLRYTLYNPNAPIVVTEAPLGGTTITGLTGITVTFSEAVTGVDASDLLVNGLPATTLTPVSDSIYTFGFSQPAFGPVAVRWASNHGIQDLEVPPNALDTGRPGATWSYVLLNPIPAVAITKPVNNAAFMAPANIAIEATATDADGLIARVEFYQSTQKVGESTESPYAITWTNVLRGDYVLSAVATDNSGLVSTSAPVVITVVTSLPITLLRGPYLQIGTPTSGIIRWRTDTNSDAVVFYGTDVTSLTNVVLGPSGTNEHIVQISGLSPDTKYFYSIGSSAQRLASGPDYWFKTSPPPGTRRPFRFWALGDSGTGNDNARAVREAYSSFAATNRPADFWLMLGDNAYNSGLDTEYQRAVFDFYPAALRNLFVWPTIGNHESAQSFTAADYPYLHIFTLPQNGEAGGMPSGSPRYYSFDYGNIHFICLDSMTSGRATNTAMVQWLVNDLAASVSDWNIAFFHHPPYTKGNHNSDAETELIEIRQNILPILEANGVDLVLNGHSHDLERSYLLNGHYGLSTTLTPAMKIDGGDGREEGTGAYRKNEKGQGVVYTVAGSSGQITGGSLNHPAHFISLNELGSLIVDVTSNRLDVRFLATNGVSRDHFTLLKRPPPAAPINLVATGVSSTEISLNWTDTSTNESGFWLERSVDGAKFVHLLTTAANVSSITDTGLVTGTTYFYRVRAVNATGESDFSSIASAICAPACPVALAQSVTVSEDGMVSVTLSPAADQASGSSPASVTYRIVRAPVNGELSGTPPDLIYRPHPGYPAGAGHADGADSFTFTVSNGQCESSEAAVTIVVKEVNDGPVADASATPLRSIISSNNLNAIAVLDGSRSSDPENDPLQFAWRESTTLIATGKVAAVTLGIGLHRVVLEVSDGSTAATDVIDMQILTAGQSVQNLIGRVKNSNLSRKRQRSLLEALDEARRDFDRGRTRQAVRKLAEFQEDVRDTIGRSDPALAAELIRLAQNTIDVVGRPAKRPKLDLDVEHGEHGIKIKFDGDDDRAYVIETSTDMIHWEPIGAAKHQGEGKFDFDGDKRTNSHRFYRVRTH